jgi:hypothetical protein
MFVGFDAKRFFAHKSKMATVAVFSSKMSVFLFLCVIMRANEKSSETLYSCGFQRI